MLVNMKPPILAEPATTAVQDNVGIDVPINYNIGPIGRYLPIYYRHVNADVIMNGGRCGLAEYSVTSPCDWLGM